MRKAVVQRVLSAFSRGGGADYIYSDLMNARAGSKKYKRALARQQALKVAQDKLQHSAGSRRGRDTRERVAPSPAPMTAVESIFTDEVQKQIQMRAAAESEAEQHQDQRQRARLDLDAFLAPLRHASQAWAVAKKILSKTYQCT